jgi:hypothetical protein
MGKRAAQARFGAWLAIVGLGAFAAGAALAVLAFNWAADDVEHPDVFEVVFALIAFFVGGIVAGVPLQLLVYRLGLRNVASRSSPYSPSPAESLYRLAYQAPLRSSRPDPSSRPSSGSGLIDLTREDEEAFGSADLRVSLRGRRCRALVREVTGVDLQDPWLPPETVRSMAKALSEHDAAGLAAINRSLASRSLSERELADLRRFFEICADRGLGLIGV